LASSLKAVVAENSSTAAKLIKQVQNDGANRATIFIRDRAILNGALKPNPVAEGHPCVQKRLWDAVHVKSGYEGILGNLLGNTYLVDELYPDTDCIDVVLDNLNTHKPSSLYKAFLSRFS